MKTLKIDENNNFIINQNSLQIIQDFDACLQDTKTRVGLCATEDFNNTRKGINFFDDALGVYAGKDDVKNQIRKRILDNDEIFSVNKINLERNVIDEDKPEDEQINNIELSAEINSIYGVLEL